MSFISILVPAIHCPYQDISSASICFAEKLNISKSDFDIVSLDPASQDNIEYAVRLHNSNLSLNYLEDILYHRSCMKIYMDKTFESMQGMMSRISLLENELREQTDSSKVSQTNLKKEGISNDSNLNKLKDLLSMQLESSESFRLNTERTLCKIKEEFELIVSEFDEIKRLDSQRRLQPKNFENENKPEIKENTRTNSGLYQLMSQTSRSKQNNNNQNFNKPAYLPGNQGNNEGNMNIVSNLNLGKQTGKKGPVFNINLNSLTINNNVNNSTSLNLQQQEGQNFGFGNSNFPEGQGQNNEFSQNQSATLEKDYKEYIEYKEFKQGESSSLKECVSKGITVVPKLKLNK